MTEPMLPPLDWREWALTLAATMDELERDEVLRSWIPEEAWNTLRLFRADVARHKVEVAG